MQALSPVHVGCARSTLARPASSVEPVLRLHVQRGAPPPWPDQSCLAASGTQSLARFKCSTVTLFPQPRRLSYLTSSSSFAFSPFSSLLFFFSALPLRVDEKLHASNHVRRCEWTRDRGHPSVLSLILSPPEPLSLTLSRRQSTGFFFRRLHLFLLSLRSRALAKVSGLNRAWLNKLGIPAVPPADLRIEAIRWPQTRS